MFKIDKKWWSTAGAHEGLGKGCLMHEDQCIQDMWNSLSYTFSQTLPLNPSFPLIGPTTNQLMRKWPGLSETAVHVHHNVWWDLPGYHAKGPHTSLWRHFSVVMPPMQASSGWGISVCGRLNSSVTCGLVVPRQMVCSAVFLPYSNPTCLK